MPAKFENVVRLKLPELLPETVAGDARFNCGATAFTLNRTKVDAASLRSARITIGPTVAPTVTVLLASPTELLTVLGEPNVADPETTVHVMLTPGVPTPAFCA